MKKTVLSKKLIQKYIFNDIYPTIRAHNYAFQNSCKIINNINKKMLSLINININLNTKAYIKRY